MVRSAARGWVRSAVKLTNKNVLITGANAGLGYETALDLAERDARVIIACRDESKAAAAKQQIRHNVEFPPKGIMKHPQAKTEDGFEMHFGVNHLGPFLLTNLLLDMMKANKSGRIVNVSSIVNYLGRLKWTDLNWEKRRYSPMGAYNASKLMNIPFTIELANRIRGTGITANSIHPGIVNTNLNRTDGQDLSITGRLTDFIFNQNFITVTPKQGAQCQIYAAVAPELQNVSGKYFSGCRKWPVGFWNATSGKSAERLWKISEELTGLKP